MTVNWLRFPSSTLSYHTLAAIVGHLDTPFPDVFITPVQSNLFQGIVLRAMPKQMQNHKKMDNRTSKGPSSVPLAPVTAVREGDDFNPEIVGEFLGFDVVLDDQTLQDVVKNDDIDTFDNVVNVGDTHVNVLVTEPVYVPVVSHASVTVNAPVTIPVVSVELVTMPVTMPAAPVVQAELAAPAAADQSVQFGFLEPSLESGPLVDNDSIPITVDNVSLAKSPVNQKRRRGRSQDIMPPAPYSSCHHTNQACYHRAKCFSSNASKIKGYC